MNLICISGSSGVGKTTIAKLLQYILGEDQSLYLSGDDLHKWSRDSSNWETKTHLNPESNNLEIGYIQIRDLMRGLSIQRSLYDHVTGKFKEPIEIHPKKYIIYVGLHSLYMPLAGISDLNIFVETDEELKNEWKITRDTHERGYTKEQVLKNINRRKEDEIKYIHPQKNNADLIIKFEKVNGRVELKYENASLSELAKNIVKKLCLFYNSTIDFIELCRKISLDPSLVQDKGGNISSKTDNGMIIKSSGFKMSDMSLSNGYCICNIPQSIPQFNCESEYMRYISGLKKGGKNNPSMETGFHIKIKSAIVCHTHPIHLNAILCSDQALDILSDIFKEYDFEFVEYTAADATGIQKLKDLFFGLGFTEVAKHRSKQAWLYKQGDINFIINAEPNSQAEAFARQHGPSVCAMAFRVKDAATALQHALANGAKEYKNQIGPMELNIPAVYGIGSSLLYFVDRYGASSVYDIDFKYYENWQVEMAKHGVGLEILDHLTHNVMRGNMNLWAGFYENIGNFREIRYFDIEGKLTGLVSKAMTAPCGKIRIPINESSDDKSQIEEFIREYKGEGIQHIALTTEDIYQTVRTLRERGMEFMPTPETYYNKVNERVEGHTEDLDQLRDLRILIDGAPMKDGILLQIFTKTVIGPVFFEIIQRKGNEGFGEGNFKALFESIEEDQIQRGVLNNA